MPFDKHKLIAEILDYISEHGKSKNDWFVGASKDARLKLFRDHQVDVRKDKWICGTAVSSDNAKEVHDYFRNILGTDGGIDDDKTPSMVYAYKKSDRTIP